MCSSRAAVVDRRDLDRGDHGHPVLCAGLQRLGHSGECVVVGERKQLHAGLSGGCHHLGRLERSVGARGMRLQVELQRSRGGWLGHGAKRTRLKRP
jgi:hypothetical protein